jgi:hypothetical protein
MNGKVIQECIKAFSVGTFIGLVIMYFSYTNSVKYPLIFGIMALSIHARNNTYIK